MRPSVARALLRGPAQASARAACQAAAFSPCHPGVAPGMRVAASSALPGTTRTFMKRRSVEEKTLPFQTPPSFAFSFDIDGVLLRSSQPIPGAAETLTFLKENNIPFTLLTNGGGLLEREKAADVSKKLGIEVPEDSVVLSHTPYRALTEGGRSLQHKNVLVTGSDPAKCRAMAEEYGFKNVIIPADILAAKPDIYPFNPLLESVHKNTARPLPAPIYEGKDSTDGLLNYLKIDAILVFNDPRDWSLDIQIIIDLLLSYRGYLGSFSTLNSKEGLPNNGYQQDFQPFLYFSNGDLTWATSHHQPRLGQGAFKAALQGVWYKLTSAIDMYSKTFGKPQREVFEYAEDALNSRRLEAAAALDDVKKFKKLKRVYMVGDSTRSDIAGANEFKSEHGTDWKSILVFTGISVKKEYDPPLGGKGTAPYALADDVREAVRWALRNEGVAFKGKI